VSTTFVRVAQDLIGPSEIAAMLGVTRQYVDRLSREDPTFPQPEARPSSGRIWSRAKVEKWAGATGRLK
jgi:predicted DNA-binding transcriptional regulator AlpA